MSVPRALRRPRLVRRAQLAGVVAAVALTVVLAQQPVRGAFDGSTASSGNQASTASTFCTSPGSATVTTDADSFVDQGSPTSASGGSAVYLVVTGQAGSARRIFVAFPMPNVPSRCTVTSATLQIWASSQVAGRTLGAYRADPDAATWTEAGLTWNNQPAHVGTPATVLVPNTDQYLSWTVTQLVRDLYASSDNGFVVRDQDETGPGAWQQFHSRAVATEKPQLTVSWG